MYSKHTRPALALLLLILASLACQAIPPQDLDKGDVTCYLSSLMQYSCACKTLQSKTTSIGPYEAQNLSNEEISERLSCGLVSGASSEDVPLPVEPTEEPAPTEPPAAPLKPYLSGDFTACDDKARYVNFTIANDAPAYDPATFKLLFNDQVAECAPPANNPRVLTCKYPPAPFGPPANILVFIGEEQVNEFSFDGGPICNPSLIPQNNNNQNNNNDEDPAPTAPPSD